jgi:hypothetical protein
MRLRSRHVSWRRSQKGLTGVRGRHGPLPRRGKTRIRLRVQAEQSSHESNFKHYRKSSAVTDYKEFPGRCHFTIGQDGWEEVADYPLDWAMEHALAERPVASR